MDSICFSKEVWELFLYLAKEYDCAIRVPINWGLFSKGSEIFYQQFGLNKERVVAKYEEQMELLKQTQIFHADWFGVPVVSEQSVKTMVKFLDSLQEGLTETACHAGYSDAELAKFNTVTEERDQTVEILINPLVRKAIENNHIILTTCSKEYELFKKTNQ